MKGQKLFLKMYIPFVIVITVALIVLQILGSKTRVGYLTDFELNIDKILELYYLTDIKENFIIDDKLDEESLNNYLLTNENITNYVYRFKIRYYDKVFRNSDIYGVYPDLSNLPDYIKEAKMDMGGSPFGNFVSSKIIEEDRIDNVNYILKIKSKILIIFCLILLVILLIYLYTTSIIDIININKINNFNKFSINTNTEKRFIILIIIIGFLLFIFQFWLGFPGNLSTHDNYWIIKGALDNNHGNWHPVLISLTWRFLFNIFGVHSFYLFLINLLLFYSGLVLIIISLYVKFKNKKVLLLYLLFLIKDIFCMNFFIVKDSTASMFVCLLYSLVFFQLFVQINNKYLRILTKIFTGIILLFSLLWRHNFIVTVYPIFILFTYLYLKNKDINNIKKYIKLFALSMLLWAFILVAIVKIFPTIWVKYKTYETNHLFLLQIAGCCVPANDDSLIPNEWYENGKTFEDAKNIYNKNPLNADNFSANWVAERPFLANQELDNLKKVWIKYILKYPLNYIKHINRFFIAYCLKDLTIKNHLTTVDSINIQITDPVFDMFDEKEQKITFTPLKEKIYDFLFSISIHIPSNFCVIMSFILFLFNTIFIFTKRFNSDILIYSFCVSFSAIAIVGIVILFTPIVHIRYLYPIYPLLVISVISFLSFIKEIRGDKK